MMCALIGAEEIFDLVTKIPSSESPCTLGKWEQGERIKYIESHLANNGSKTCSFLCLSPLPTP